MNRRAAVLIRTKLHQESGNCLGQSQIYFVYTGDIYWDEKLAPTSLQAVDDTTLEDFRINSPERAAAQKAKDEKAGKDTRDNLGKAAAVAIKAVTKFLDDETDPRRVETLTSSVVGGIAAVVATIYGGPLAGAAAEVAASKIVTFLFDYHPPYKVQDLSTSVMLNDEQRRLIDVVSNKQVGELLSQVDGLHARCLA